VTDLSGLAKHQVTTVAAGAVDAQRRSLQDLLLGSRVVYVSRPSS
jgi:hypothetical protein